MLSNDIKNQIVSTLKPLKPEKIILFGSYAYGNPDKESDIDLLLIKKLTPEEVRPFRIKAKKLLWEKFKSASIHFDVLVDSEDRINDRIRIGDLFYEEIYNKGQIIYA